MKTEMHRMAPSILLWVLLTSACSTGLTPKTPYTTISRDRLPDLSRRSFEGIPSESLLWYQDGFAMTLDLGTRRRVSSMHMFRTSSKYLLSGADHLMWAESVLAQTDVTHDGSDLNPSIRLFHDPLTRSFLVHEEHSWSVDRVILFQVDHPKTKVRYLRIPRLPGGLPHLREYRIEGIHDGTLYIEKAGVIHALPIESLADEEALAYGFG
jgi:hypothetical protein